MNTEAILEILVPFLQGWEKLRLKAYLDRGSKGKWTVGWGCTGKGINKDTIWTKEQADAEFYRRVNEVIKDALLLTPGLRYATPSQIAAVCAFIYNIGISAYSTSTARKRINERDWDATATEMAKWHHSEGEDNRGLKRRRAAEIKLLKV